MFPTPSGRPRAPPTPMTTRTAASATKIGGDRPDDPGLWPNFFASNSHFRQRVRRDDSGSPQSEAECPRVADCVSSPRRGGDEVDVVATSCVSPGAKAGDGLI